MSVKPRVYRNHLGQWDWTCDCCGLSVSSPLDQQATFAIALRHARSVVHQFRAESLHRARRTGWPT
jgi:hypothetical protein